MNLAKNKVTAAVQRLIAVSGKPFTDVKDWYGSANKTKAPKEINKGTVEKIHKELVESYTCLIVEIEYNFPMFYVKKGCLYLHWAWLPYMVYVRIWEGMKAAKYLLSSDYSTKQIAKVLYSSANKIELLHSMLTRKSKRIAKGIPENAQKQPKFQRLNAWLYVSSVCV